MVKRSINMNNYEFVEIINTEIKKTVVKMVEEDLNECINSDKYPILKELSQWYNTKDDVEKLIITKLIKNVYDNAAWRILHMLDEDREYGGRFELYFIDNNTNEKTLFIDPPHLEELHELYELEF